MQQREGAELQQSEAAHLLAHLILDLGVVCVCVEHHHRVCQHIRHIRALEILRVAADIALSKLFDQPVNLLRLSGQAEAVQEHPEIKAQCVKTAIRPDGRGRRYVEISIGTGSGGIGN